MGKALYRKYRSRSFEEILGQSHITETLKNIINNDKFSHAYLLTGPRGVGKTSVARLIAHAVNGLDYEAENNHLDIIEIDAASNRRIDEIRELRDKVHNAPAAARYKVYIIDEVHMLTREAFNALLKTLEEPPDHAIFILATTEAHKVPETITSRTQQFHFKPIATTQVARHLLKIAKLENIALDNDAADLIARHGDGSFRDSIGLLEQLAGMDSKITKQLVLEILGKAPEDSINQIIASISSGNVSETSKILSSLSKQGIRPMQLTKQLIQAYREKIINSNDKDNDTEITLNLIKNLLNVPRSSDLEIALEVVLIEAALNADKPITQKSMQQPDTTESSKLKNNKRLDKPEKIQKTIVNNPGKMPSTTNNDAWEDILKRIKNTHNTLYSLARMANAELKTEAGSLTLGFQYEFHYKRVSEPSNKSIISRIAAECTGKTINVTCVLNVPAAKPESVESVALSTKDDSLKGISNIFGGAEVLDS